MNASRPGCQLSGSEEAAQHLPWADDQRAVDKTRLFEYALQNTDGAIISEAVKAVFDKESTTADADYKLANRFYSSYSEYFKIDRRDRHTWVEPTTAAFHLTTSKRSSKTHDSTDIAKSNARAALTRRRRVTSDEARSVVLGALAAKRYATDDKHLILQDTCAGDSHIIRPYHTVYNSSERVNRAIGRYQTAWSAAAAEYDRGVLITLTTDPYRYDSIAGATDGLMKDFNRWKSWLTSRFFDGRRPPHIAVPEFTKAGLPHLHVAIFGTGYIPHAAVVHNWDQRRDRGRFVWIDGMKARGGKWRWRGRHERTEARCPQTYLGKGLRQLKSLAEVDADCVKEAAGRLRSGRTRQDDEAHEWWRLACRWALDVKLFTCSSSLTQGHDQGTSSESERAPQWRFIGASQYGTIPGYIRRERFTRASEPTAKPPPG